MMLTWESAAPVARDKNELIVQAGKHQGRAMACDSLIHICKHMPAIMFGTGVVLVWVDLSLCLAQAALGCFTFGLLKLANRYGAIEHFKGRVLFFTATGRDPCAPEMACGKLPAGAHELRRVWLAAREGRSKGDEQ